MPPGIDNIALISAAGAGKTRALTRRFLHLYLHEHGFPLASLYGITFTNEAAFEMKMRIMKYLNLLAAEQPGDESESDIVDYFRKLSPDIKRLAASKTRELLNNLSDLKISTFHSLFASFLSSIPFAAGILPGYEIIDETQEQFIFDTVCDKFFEDAVTHKEIYDVFQEMLEQQETRIKGNIKKVFWSVIPWLDYLQDLVEKEKGLRREVNETEKNFLNILKELKNFVAANESYAYTKTKKEVNKNFAGLLAKIDEFIKTGDLEKIKDTIFGVDITSKNYIQSFMNNLAERSGEFAKILEDLKAIEEPYLNYLSDQQIIIHLRPLLEIYRLFQREKQNRNLLSFDDIEAYTLQALKNNPEPDYLYFKIGAEISHLMIDEFQDTSFRQLEILDPLISEITSVSPIEKSLFYVGDPRQAIFRWRGGTPELFNLLKQKYKDKIKDEELLINYRSKEEIIKFVNKILDKNDKAKPGNVGGWVRIENLGDFADKEEGDKKVAAKTAQVIEDLHRKHGYDYSDIAVLVRTNEFGILVAEELAKEHLPCVSRSRADILSDDDVRFVINLIRFLDDPENDFALLHVLISPLFMIREETIRRLKTTKKTLYMGLTDLHPDWEITKKLQTLLSFVHFCNPYELIYRIYKELGLKISYSLATLLDAALEYTKNGYSHLSAFIDWLERVGMAIEVKEVHPEGVKVLTVHKAKGLEFEVVIIPDTNWSVMPYENKQLLFSYRENGAEPEKIYWRSYGKYLRHLKEKEQYRLSNDELNLLYVALTRAKSGIHIIGYQTASHGFGFWMNTIAEKLGGIDYSVGAIIEKTRSEGEEKRQSPYDAISQGSMTIKEERSLYSPTERGVEIIETERRQGMEFGRMVHDALSRIEWLDGLEVDDYLRGLIEDIKNIYVRLPEDTSEIDNRVMPLLKETITDPELRFIFYKDGRNVKCKNELPVYFEEAKRDVSVHIDRLIIGEEELYIIEYKTGEEKQDYKKQMVTYKNGIAQIYPGQVVRPVIVYLEKQRGKKILRF